MINDIINKILINGAIKIYPYDNYLEDMGFYIIINNTSRIKEKIYQVTLFFKDTPYMHKLVGENLLKAEIECSYNVFDEKVKASLCDSLVYELTELKEKPSEEENKRVEKIQLLVAKYDKYLSDVNEEQFNHIKNVFDMYIQNKEETIENVELFLKQQFYI